MEAEKDDGPRPVVTFFQPQSSQEVVLFSLCLCSEAALRKFLPKSHISNVIIRDNTSVQRVQEIKELMRCIRAQMARVNSKADKTHGEHKKSTPRLDHEDDGLTVLSTEDAKLRHLDNSKRKVGNYCEHLKKTFWHDQQNKMNRWKHQYSRYQRMLEKIDQRAKQEVQSNSIALLNDKKPSVQLPKAILKKK